MQFLFSLQNPIEIRQHAHTLLFLLLTQRLQRQIYIDSISSYIRHEQTHLTTFYTELNRQIASHVRIIHLFMGFKAQKIVQKKV